MNRLAGVVLLSHAYYQPKRESSNFAFRKDAPKTRRINLCTTAADLGLMVAAMRFATFLPRR
ncbi:hypothetical protein AB0K20_15205 [Micromonospora matsumotoense]|uniref:hypothetical protein n=1 Tax=Micromonospora matsumotoense TaxID=121616 RepID=UPI003422A931